MDNACHEGLIAKFDQLISKLQTRIMKKERLQVSENGTYTAPENTGYTVVDVNVASSDPVNLQPKKEVVIETPNQGFDGVLVTPDEGYDGLESVKCFAPTVEIAVTENGTYEARRHESVGFYKVNVNVPQKYETDLIVDENGVYIPPSGTVYSDVTAVVPNVPNYIRGSGRINVKNKTISTQGQQSIMSTNVMEEDTLPIETEEQKKKFLDSTFFAFVTGIVDGNVQENPFTETIFQADIELQNQSGVPVYSYSKIPFILKEHHEIALTNNNVTSGFEMVTFFQRKVGRCIPKAEINDGRVVKAVLKKIYCEVTPKPAFLPIVLKEGTYVYVSVFSPSRGQVDE